MKRVFISVMIALTFTSHAYCYKVMQYCKQDNIYCTKLVEFVNKDDPRLSNFWLYDHSDINNDYEAVILYSQTNDTAEVFVVDKNTKTPYMRIARLSGDSQDAHYEFSETNLDYIEIDGLQGSYGQVQVKLRYFIDLKTKQIRSSFQ